LLADDTPPCSGSGSSSSGWCLWHLLLFWRAPALGRSSSSSLLLLLLLMVVLLFKEQSSSKQEIAVQSLKKIVVHGCTAGPGHDDDRLAHGDAGAGRALSPA